jgi:peptidyl-tRNA hydrolase
MRLSTTKFTNATGRNVQDAKQKKKSAKKNDRLYILMRRDLASLNPGKAVAQGAHAATKFMDDVYRWGRTGNEKARHWVDRMEKWLGNRGFGTKICLSAGSVPMPGDKDELYVLEGVVKQAREQGFPTGLVLDPTYPLVDGSACHLIPVVTCAYVFGDAEELAPLLGTFRLMS